MGFDATFGDAVATPAKVGRSNAIVSIAAVRALANAMSDALESGDEVFGPMLCRTGNVPFRIFAAFAPRLTAPALAVNRALKVRALTGRRVKPGDP